MENSLEYTQSYNRIANDLREALLRQASDATMSCYDIVKDIFQKIDGNDSGAVTSDEMLAFLKWPELNLFYGEEHNLEKFCQLLLEQIDMNGDGTISLEELANFLFPEVSNEEKPLEYEAGIVFEFTRSALTKQLGQYAGSEEQLFSEFAKIANAELHEGCMGRKLVHKALMNIFIPEFSRNLQDIEADLIIQKLDTEHSGRVSARSFKNWLFPAKNGEERVIMANALFKIIKDHYQGDPRNLYDQCKSYDADCIFKADFITHIRAAEPSFPRQSVQDLASILTGGEKVITFSNILDLLGFCQEFNDIHSGHPAQDTPQKFSQPIEGYPSPMNQDPVKVGGGMTILQLKKLVEEPDDEEFHASTSTSLNIVNTPIHPPIQTPIPSGANKGSLTLSVPNSPANSTVPLSEGFSSKNTSALNTPMKKSNSLEARQPLFSQSYVESYNRIAQDLRDALLRQASDPTMSCYDIVKEVFKKIDGNDSGSVTSQEMMTFLKWPELNLFYGEEHNIEKFCQLLLEQIDENNDGTISLQELATFIFPESETDDAGEHEPGIIFDFARKALRQTISPAAAQASEDSLLEEFAQLAKASVRKGILEGKAAKKAFMNLYIPEFSRKLLENEADTILRKLDNDNTGRVTSKSFKSWLFPSNNFEEKSDLANNFYKIVKDHYHGDPRDLFDQCKSYGAECIYKADFVTHIRAADPTLSRQFVQDLAASLTGGEKYITYANILDLLGFCQEYRETHGDSHRILNPESAAVDQPEPVKEITQQQTEPQLPPPRRVSPESIPPLDLKKGIAEESFDAPPSLQRQNASQKLSIEVGNKDIVPQSPALATNRPGNLNIPMTPSFQKPPIKKFLASNDGMQTPLKKSASSDGMNFNRQNPPVQSYAQSYNRIAHDLRDALLRQASDPTMSCYDIVKEVFQKIDGNDSGAVTSQEMVAFLKWPELNLFYGEEHNVEKFCQLLLEQIDENGDGSISLEELAAFIFPDENKELVYEHEPGIVYDFARKALMQKVSSAAGQGSDDLLLSEFANLAKATVRKGILDGRAAKKALLNLYIPEFSRPLQGIEADLIIHKLDMENYGRISSKAFKHWLFPTNNYEEKANIANQFFKIIKEHYNGDPRALYEQCKSYGADCIYKADFITHIRAADPSLSRQTVQDLATTLTGGEKLITFANILDLLGFCEEFQELIAASENVSQPDSLPNSARGLPSSSNSVMGADSFTVAGREAGSPRSEVSMGNQSVRDRSQQTQQYAPTPKKAAAAAQKKSVIPELLITEEEREMIRKLLSSPERSRPMSPLQRSASLRRLQNPLGVSQSLPLSETINFQETIRSATQESFPFSNSTTLNSTTSLSKKKDEQTNKPKYGALGYTADQLAEFGYEKHAGRWRGFPYDSYSCCDTSLLICPNAKKIPPKKVYKKKPVPNVSIAYGDDHEPEQSQRGTRRSLSTSRSRSSVDKRLTSSTSHNRFSKTAPMNSRRNRSKSPSSSAQLRKTIF